MRKTRSQEPRILERPDHNLSRKHIPEHTLKVLYRLHKSDKKGYMVGGAVRDLLLGRTPKDFDVGTDARPGEVRRLFKNSRIIGRRFRLVHVYFKDGIVEVATFRRQPDPEHQDSNRGELLITSDNTWGTPEEDAFRRDFTINALFYDISDFSVIDYCGGIDDLDAGIVRVIGDPDVRFREDPVRMVRACEFAARLGFEIEPVTADGIDDNAGEITKAAPARLTEEIVQLMKCGHAGDAFQLLLDFRLLDIVLPEARPLVEAPKRGLEGFNRIPLVFDSLVEEEREVSDVALLAAMLLPAVTVSRDEKESRDRRVLSRSQVESLTAGVLGSFFDRFTLANAKRQDILTSLSLFSRMCEPGWSDRRRIQFAVRRCFDDALVVFEILVRATGEGQAELAAWRTAQRQRPERDKGSRGDRGDSGGRRGRGRNRRRRRRRRRKRRS